MTRKPPAMRELSLFSGAGGGLLATKHLLGWETVGYVENNEHCQKVIKARIRDGLLDNAPGFGDIRQFIADGYADAYSGMVDVVSFGAPCQPFSQAARGRNTAGDLLSLAVTVCRIVKPGWFFCESVLGAAKRFRQLRTELEGEGFCVGPVLRLDAGALGAPHPRARLWLAGHTNGNGEPTLPINDEVARLPAPQAGGNQSVWWQNHPGSLRVDDGMANYLEQSQAVGNGQVPAVAATAWRLLSGE